MEDKYPLLDELRSRIISAMTLYLNWKTKDSSPWINLPAVVLVSENVTYGDKYVVTLLHDRHKLKRFSYTTGTKKKKRKITGLMIDDLAVRIEDNSVGGSTILTRIHDELIFYEGRFMVSEDDKSIARTMLMLSGADISDKVAIDSKVVKIDFETGKVDIDYRGYVRAYYFCS